MPQDDPDKVTGESPGSAAQSAAEAFAATVAHDAMKSDPQLTDDARLFLREQAYLAKLQSQNLAEQNALELSHLRFRRFSDYAKVAAEAAVALVAVVALIGFCVLVWQARQAQSLVIEPFHTPPDLAAQGLDGTVLAQHLLDRVNALVRTADPFDPRPPDQISGNWGNESKVAIPQTGVSIGELSRTLRMWLGHERHLSGEVWHGNNVLMLTVRLDDGEPVTVSASAAEFGSALDRVAEVVLKQTQPFRYVGLLTARRKTTAAIREMQTLVRDGPPADRKYALSGLMELYFLTGNISEAAHILDQEVADYPDDPADPPAYIWLGHIEKFIQLTKRNIRLLKASANGTTSRFHDLFTRTSEGNLSAVLGAYLDFLPVIISRSQDDTGRVNENALPMVAAAYANVHDIRAAKDVLRHLPGVSDADGVAHWTQQGNAIPYFYMDTSLDRWGEAVVDLVAADRANEINPAAATVRRTTLWPILAATMATAGNVSGARRLATKLPMDSDYTPWALGVVASYSGDMRSADYWFAKAVGRAPSYPLFYYTWAQALALHGDLERAAEILRTAHEKGPRYADPLELWGEVLIRQDRSDLALAKFEEASHYAPNWGRLHLKWGEALLWLGHKDEASRQFGIASDLDLSSSDRAQLQTVRRRV
jgi:tetratricopeptide (TPR) repeat protein